MATIDHANDQHLATVGPDGVQNRLKVGIDDVPLDIQHAVLAAEDHSFYTNPGFDVTGILRAMWSQLSGGDGQVLYQAPDDPGDPRFFAQVARKLNRVDDQYGELVAIPSPGTPCLGEDRYHLERGGRPEQGRLDRRLHPDPVHCRLGGHRRQLPHQTLPDGRCTAAKHPATSGRNSWTPRCAINPSDSSVLSSRSVPPLTTTDGPSKTRPDREGHGDLGDADQPDNSTGGLDPCDYVSCDSNALFGQPRPTPQLIEQ